MGLSPKAAFERAQEYHIAAQDEIVNALIRSEGKIDDSFLRRIELVKQRIRNLVVDPDSLESYELGSGGGRVYSDLRVGSIIESVFPPNDPNTATYLRGIRFGFQGAAAECRELRATIDEAIKRARAH